MVPPLPPPTAAATRHIGWGSRGSEWPCCIAAYLPSVVYRGAGTAGCAPSRLLLACLVSLPARPTCLPADPPPAPCLCLSAPSWQVLEYEQQYLNALPLAEMYEKSYMHRDTGAGAVCGRGVRACCM